MKYSKNVIEQLYQFIENEYGCKQASEYFTLVYKGPQIHVNNLCNHEINSVSKTVEEDSITNCLCAPYHVVSDKLPYTLSSRYQFAISNWIMPQQISNIQNGMRIYQSEFVFFEAMQEKMQHAFEVRKGICTNFDVHNVKQWEQEYASLYEASNCLYEYCQNEHHTYSFGAEELLEARNRCKEQRIMIPDSGYAYPVHCYPEDWGIHLLSSFESQDTIPSLHDIIKNIFICSEQIEEQVKKILFYVSQEDQEFIKLRKVRNELIEQIVNLTNDYFHAHDQCLIFLIGSVFAKGQIVNSKTWKALFDFFQMKTKDKELRFIFDKQKKKQYTYFKTLIEMTTHSFKDHNCDEIRLNLVDLLEDIKHWEKQLYLANNEAFMMKSAASRLLLRKISEGYQSFVCSSSFANFFESSQLLQEEGTPRWLQIFFGQQVPNELDEEKMKKVKLTLGCQIRQISIERPWLVEDVFHLSFAYQRVCHEKISQGVENLKNINKKTLLPAIPVRIVIAKDITLRLNFQDAGRDMMDIVKRSAQYGKGFLCFQEATNTCIPFIEEDEYILTLRYPKPYVIGYFMQFTPDDQSKKIGGVQNG